MCEVFKLDEKTWPVERRWKATAKARGRYFGELCLGMYEKWGEEALDVVGKVYADAAKRTFLKGLKDFGLEGRGADTLARFFLTSQAVLGLKMEAVELTPEKSVVRYHTCHLFSEPSRAAEQICRRAIFNFELTAVGLLNPQLKIYFTSLMTAGDPYCEWICELQQD